MITTVLFRSLHAHTRTHMLCTQDLRDSPEAGGLLLGLLNSATMSGETIVFRKCLCAVCLTRGAPSPRVPSGDAGPESGGNTKLSENRQVPFGVCL